MLDDGGDVRGSLDDFYTIQNANGGLDSVMNDSLNNSPRKMQPVSYLCTTDYYCVCAGVHECIVCMRNMKKMCVCVYAYLCV